MNNDDIWNARNVDLYNYFRSKGFKLQKEPKNRWRVCEYGGLVIYGCTYYHFSTDTSGNAVDCLVKIFKYDFKDAVQELLGYPVMNIVPPEEKKIKSSFKLPELNKDQHRAFAYLYNTRKIDKEIISWLLKNKLLFQDTKGNCVFPWYDEDNKIVGAEIVGTLDKLRFKQISECSLIGYGFFVKYGSPDRAYFFESAIDLLSYITMNKNDLDNSILLSLGGLKKEAIFKIKNTYKDINLVTCFDNDKAGINFTKIIAEELKIDTLFPTLKDWNDDLKARCELKSK